MVVRELNYAKRFEAKAGSAELNEQDKIVQGLFKEKFSLDYHSFDGCSGFFGSDGSFAYIFRFQNNEWDYSGEQTFYDSVIKIRKSGAEAQISELSDIEIALIESGFVKR